jgi:cell division protein FtsQ
LPSNPRPAREGRGRDARRPRTDPRIAARRIEVKRTEGRKRLRRLLVGMAALAAIAAAGLSTRTPLLDVDHVRITGAERVPADELAAIANDAGVARGEPLVQVDSGDVEDALEALPGIASADVQRRWPGTVAIHVVERAPVASITTPGGVAVVAADGVVLDVLPAAPVWAVALDGVSVDPEPGARVDAPELLEVAAALPPALAAEVVAVATAGPELQLRLRDPEGAVARLGDVDELDDKLVAVATALDQIELACLLTIDARVPSAPAVTRVPGCGS